MPSYYWINGNKILIRDIHSLPLCFDLLDDLSCDRCYVFNVGDGPFKCGNWDCNGHSYEDEPECYGPCNIQLMSDIYEYETRRRIDHRIRVEQLHAMRRQNDLNYRIGRLEGLVNRYPGGTARHQPGSLDGEREAEASFDGQLDDDAITNKTSIGLLDVSRIAPSNRGIGDTVSSRSQRAVQRDIQGSMQDYGRASTSLLVIQNDALEYQKHEDEEYNQFNNQRASLRQDVRQAQHQQNTLTPMSNMSLKNGLVSRDNITLGGRNAQHRNTEGAELTSRELPASSRTSEQSGSMANLSIYSTRKLPMGKNPAVLDDSTLDDPDLLKVLELSKQTADKSRYELELEEALQISQQELTTSGLSSKLQTELKAATEESLKLGISDARGNFMSIQEMAAKANRIKLARGEDVDPNNGRLRARGSKATSSALHRPTSTLAATSPSVESSSSWRANKTLAAANQAKSSIRRRKNVLATQHGIGSTSTSAASVIQAPDALGIGDKEGEDPVPGYSLEPRPGERSINP
ncbi:hypothetical protein AOQ84DRAFT_372968 [Glonium stellatum]|uniref:Uncharacterized protein n=1 Tax=Glonium stellatum TaxID=574774 RepID=A0A8E2JWU8_9PEZI|nr:hypothetical protein AOQ84DRAFT_372968 [Glonium stellatum]